MKSSEITDKIYKELEEEDLFLDLFEKIGASEILKIIQKEDLFSDFIWDLQEDVILKSEQSKKENSTGKEFKRFICDILGKGYHVASEELLAEIKKRIYTQ